MSDPYRTAADRGESPENPFQCEEVLVTLSKEEVGVGFHVEIQRPAGAVLLPFIAVVYDRDVGSARRALAKETASNPDLARRLALAAALRSLADEIQVHGLPRMSKAFYP